jgi:type VI secretion system secreted protein VgrG
VSIGAGKDVNLATSTSFNVNALKSIAMAAGEALSLFAHNLGIKLLAARGKVQIQAQSDELTMSALKDMTVTSTDGKIVISAAKELWIGAAGSYIRMTACNMEIATPGDLFEKALSFKKDGPSSMMRKATLPYTSDLPDTGAHGSKFSGWSSRLLSLTAFHSTPNSRHARTDTTAFYTGKHSLAHHNV